MRTIPLSFVLILLVGIGLAQLRDNPGFKDPALFTRMPDFYLPYSSSFKEVQFDAQDFLVSKANTVEKRRVEGHKTEYCYYFDKSTGKVPPSSLQVQRNFQNAITRLGGKVLFSEDRNYYQTTLFVDKNGTEIWAEIRTDGNANADRYYLTIIEVQAMQQEVLAKADALKGGLAETGHVEVPGIFFDFNKAEIKPESRPALEEIVKLLQGNPAMRVWVVGHTDNVGLVESNLTLSSARAAAVVKALVQSGIEAKRLEPRGAGPFAPVVANTTEEKRARNRRVELVAQP